MAKLSKVDEAFLLKHKIPLSSTFDASGMPTREWKAAMRDEGKFVAYGVECIRDRNPTHGGQALKTRSGNCIRCNAANITFALRPAKDGCVYVAWSESLALVKIGYSKDPAKRVYDGNCRGYAGAKDWRIYASSYSTNAGRLELAVHSILKDYRVPQLWNDNGIERQAGETYSCGLSQAITALRSKL